MRPAFCGHKIMLDEAAKIVLRLTIDESYIPIPTKQVDLETHVLRKAFRILKKNTKIERKIYAKNHKV